MQHATKCQEPSPPAAGCESKQGDLPEAQHEQRRQPPRTYKDRSVTVQGARSSSAGRRLQQAAPGLPTIRLSLEATAVSTLVLPISLEGCPNPAGTYPAPWYFKEDVEKMIFEDGGNDGAATSSVGALFRTCSYGQTLLTRQNSVVAPVIKLDCAGTSAWGTPYNSKVGAEASRLVRFACSLGSSRQAAQCRGSWQSRDVACPFYQLQSCEFEDFSGWSELAMEKAQQLYGINPDDYLYK